MIKKFFAVSPLLLITITAFAENEMLSFLPDTSRFEGLTTTQQPMIYSGNELFTMIDGGADVYFEFGFEQALSASYMLGQDDQIDVQLYKMKDTPAAFGILTHSRSGKDSITDSGCYEILSPHYTMFQKGAYFGVISWSQSELNTAIHAALTMSIAGKIDTNSALPPLATQAFNAGFKINQLKYIRGKIALSANYFFSHKDLFAIEDALCIEEADSKYFVFTYTNPEKPMKQLDLVRAEFSGSSKISGFSEDEGQISFTDRKNQKISFSLSGNYLFVSVVPENREANWNRILEIYR